MNQHPILPELKMPYRGCRAIVKVKAKWWRYTPFLPFILMGNVNPLPNKSDELETLVKLEALVRNQRLDRECSLMCLTETWLNRNIPDSCVDLPWAS